MPAVLLPQSSSVESESICANFSVEKNEVWVPPLEFRGVSEWSRKSVKVLPVE